MRKETNSSSTNPTIQNCLEIDNGAAGGAGYFSSPSSSALWRYSSSPDTASPRTLLVHGNSPLTVRQLLNHPQRKNALEKIRIPELTRPSTGPRSSGISPHHLPRRFWPTIHLPGGPYPRSRLAIGRAYRRERI